MSTSGEKSTKTPSQTDGRTAPGKTSDTGMMAYKVKRNKHTGNAEIMSIHTEHDQRGETSQTNCYRSSIKFTSDCE